MDIIGRGVAKKFSVNGEQCQIDICVELIKAFVILFEVTVWVQR